MRFPDCSEVKQLTLIVRRDEVGLSSGSIVSEHHQDGLLAVVMLVALCEPYVAAVVLLTLAGLDRHQQPCTTPTKPSVNHTQRLRMRPFLL